MADLYPIVYAAAYAVLKDAWAEPEQREPAAELAGMHAEQIATAVSMALDKPRG